MTSTHGAEPQHAAPCESEGSGAVGVTNTMCAEFCRRNNANLRVLYRNTRIFNNDPDYEGKDRTMHVYQTHGKHTFFYNANTTQKRKTQ